MATEKFNIGDEVEYLANYDTIRIGDIDNITFIGNHNGMFKIMTTKLDKYFPTKNGWFYKYQFRLVKKKDVVSSICIW